MPSSRGSSQPRDPVGKKKSPVQTGERCYQPTFLPGRNIYHMFLWMIISKVSHHRIFKITMGGGSLHESPQYLDSFSHLSPSLGDGTKISYKFASKMKNDELLLCKTGNDQLHRGNIPGS